MIKQAISLDKNSEYYNLDIEKMSYRKTFLMWYFPWKFLLLQKSTKSFLKYINNYIIKPGG